VTAPANPPDKIGLLNLTIAKARWKLGITDANADVTELRSQGSSLYRGRAKMLSFPPGTSERAVEWLRRQLATLEPGTTFNVAQARDLEIPESPAEAEKALDELEREEKEVVEKIEEFNKLRAEVDELVEELYK
jgi:hypothetical protein